MSAKHILLLSILLIALVILVYYPVSGFDFITLDDPAYFSQNYRVRQGLSWDNVRWAFTREHAAYWIPATWLSFMLDVEIFGDNAMGCHVTNMLLHGANAILFFLFLWRATALVWPSWFAAALFALHPQRVESVAWVTERKDVLSALFFLLLLLAWHFHLKKPSHRRLALCLAAFILGIMSKPMLVSVPLLLLLLDFWPFARLGQTPGDRQCQADNGKACSPRNGGGKWRIPPIFCRSNLQLLKEKIPFILLALATIPLTLYTQRTAMPGGNRGLLYTLTQSLDALWGYLKSMFYPVDLSLLYPLVYETTGLRTILLAIPPLAITLFILKYWRRIPAVMMGWLWFLIALGPVIGIVQVGSQMRADRFTYIPHMGLSVAVAWLVFHLCNRVPALQRIAVVAGLAVLGTLAVCSRGYLSRWENSKAIYTHSISVAPNSPLMHESLGKVYMDEKNLEEARRHLRISLRLDPAFSSAWTNLGATYLLENQPQKAVPFLEKGLSLDPRMPEANAQLGVAFWQMGDKEGAEKYFRLSLRLRPDQPITLSNLAAIMALKGNTTEAIRLYRESVFLNPNESAPQAGLGSLCLQAGDAETALAHLNAAIRLDPRNRTLVFLKGYALLALHRSDEGEKCLWAGLLREPKTADAWYNLGLLAYQRRDLANALRLLRIAAAITPRNTATQNLLGIVSLGLGQKDKARHYFEEVLRISPNHPGARRNLSALGSLPACR